jgi:hypothetical protein
VDKAGEPSIVMLSPEGKVIYRAANGSLPRAH